MARVVEELPEPMRGLLSVVGAGNVPVGEGARAAHRAILRSFATTGAPPTTAEIAAAVAPHGSDVETVLAELVERDAIGLAADGSVAVAYPFSAAPTAHRVRVDARAAPWSMCAVDALGVAVMLGRDTVVESGDPLSGEPVTVTFTDGTATWEPDTAVVFVGGAPGGGPAAAVCCASVNFFATAGNAAEWARQHPEVRGTVLDQARAERLGAEVFGALLRD